MKYIILLPLFCLLTSCSTLHRHASSSGQLYRAGTTTVTIDDVDSKDPTGELESKTQYFSSDDLERFTINKEDGLFIECSSYFVIQLNQSGLYSIQICCQATGNQQVLVHSPCNPKFKQKDFRDIIGFKTFRFDFDAKHSKYLIINCTKGNLHLDAVKVEQLKS